MDAETTIGRTTHAVLIRLVTVRDHGRRDGDWEDYPRGPYTGGWSLSGTVATETVIGRTTYVVRMPGARRAQVGFE